MPRKEFYRERGREGYVVLWATGHLCLLGRALVDIGGKMDFGGR